MYFVTITFVLVGFAVEEQWFGGFRFQPISTTTANRWSVIYNILIYLSITMYGCVYVRIYTYDTFSWIL